MLAKLNALLFLCSFRKLLCQSESRPCHVSVFGGVDSLNISSLPTILSAHADNVLKSGSARPLEAVPFHHHRGRGAGLPLAAAVVPLAAAHQPRLADPQLRLHHPCLSRLHSSR